MGALPKAGAENIGCHKGVPFGQFMARYARPGDFDAVVDDFPDLNWIVFHSAWPYHQELAALKVFKGHRKNLYCELGSCFAATVTQRPRSVPTFWVPFCGTSVPSTSCGARTPRCGPVPSGRSKRSGAAGSRLNWWRGMAIPN